MLCTKCGEQLPDKSQFCPQCGADLSSTSQNETDASTTAASCATEPATKHTATSHFVIAAVASFVLVAGIGFGGLYFFTSSDDTPVAENTQAELDEPENIDDPAQVDAVQAVEQSDDNNGEFGPMQRHKGILYAGQLHYPGTQIELEGTTPFFGNTDYFYFADDKAYWIDEHHANDGGYTVSLYSADVDGSNQKTLAEDVVYPSSLYAVGDTVFFSSQPYPSRAYLDTKTGERGDMPSNIQSYVGVCNNRLVVALESPSYDTNGLITLAFYDPATKEMTDIPSGEMNYAWTKIKVSDAGIVTVATKDGTASFYSPDGSPVWTDTATPELSTALNATFADPLMTDTTYYWAAENDKEQHTFAIGKINLATGEQATIPFEAPEVAALNSPGLGFSYQNPLYIDGDSMIVVIVRGNYADASGQSCFLYKVSLEDGTSECLKQWVA